MAMKSILVPIADTAVDPAAIEIALMVAKAVTGHVKGLYIETPAPLTMRTGRLAGYEATREVALPRRRSSRRKSSRARRRHVNVPPSRPGPNSSASAPRRACRCARQTLPIPCPQPPGAKPKARMRAR